MSSARARDEVARRSRKACPLLARGQRDDHVARSSGVRSISTAVARVLAPRVLWSRVRAVVISPYIDVRGAPKRRSRLMMNSLAKWAAGALVLAAGCTANVENP